MGLPSQPVTLSVQQIDEINQKLSTMRHDVNNILSLVLAAIEVARYKPQTTDRMIATLAEQPPKIGQAVGRFSDDFEKLFGITRD